MMLSEVPLDETADAAVKPAAVPQSMRTLFGCEVLKPLPLMVMVTEFMPDVYEEGEMEVMTGASSLVTVKAWLLENWLV
jgi:hypothetical protein